MTARTRSNIVLIGYRGSGKSTVGKILADRLGIPHVDTDALIVAKAGQTIAEIFAREGEAGFRQRESEAIAEIADRHGTVISLGGGAVINDDNLHGLSPAGRIVWLRCSPDTIYRRVHEDPSTVSARPPLTDQSGFEEIRSVLDQREPLYRRWADFVIETDNRSPQQVADDILRALASPSSE